MNAQKLRRPANDIGISISIGIRSGISIGISIGLGKEIRAVARRRALCRIRDDSSSLGLRTNHRSQNNHRKITVLRV